MKPLTWLLREPLLHFVVIGGLISDDYEDDVTKVPWLGDIPFFGWLFKTTGRRLVKTNLLIFLTLHIVRSVDELQAETIRKRFDFYFERFPIVAE